MDALRTEVTIERPPAVVYEYLIDIANHPEFLDHYLVGWHLTREDTYGLGAGARFKVGGGDRFSYGDMTIVEAERPLRIVLRGRGGRFNRIRSVYHYELVPSPTGEATKLQLEVTRDLKAPYDRMRDLLGGRFSERRQWRRALNRLAAILERGEQRGQRATLSGGPRKPATGTPLR